MAEATVLATVKEMVGPSALYEGFDTDLLIHINSSLMYLAQMGVVPDGTKITSSSVWSDLLGNETALEGIKSYLYFKARMMFDPPANSIIANAWNEEIKQLEFRLMIGKEECAGHAN
jgi:hypothetical protein